MSAMNMKKTLTALMLGSLLCAAGAVQAAGPASSVATGTANLVFAATGTATVKITPVSGLLAGTVNTGTKLADVAIDVTSGAPAWRWTPGTGTIQAGVNNYRNEVTGNGGNKLKVLMYNNLGDSTRDSATGWWVLNSSVSNKLHKDILITKDQTETVSPDTYPVSIDAVVWAY